MTSPMDRQIHIESLGWAPSTPSGGVKAEVIMFSELSPEKIKAQAGKLKGRAVMLDLASIFADGFGAFAKLIAALPLFKEVGAAAIIVSQRWALRGDPSGSHYGVAKKKACWARRRM